MVHLLGVDDADVHARLRDSVVKEHGVDRLADLSHPAEPEGEIRDASRDLHKRARLLDDLRGLDEVDSVVVVLFHSGADGEHVRVEDDVLGRELDLLHQDLVRPLADANLLVAGRCLTLLIEGHDDRRGAVLLQKGGVLLEQLLADLQGDGVHDGLALAPLQPRDDNLEVASVKHERGLGHLRLRHRDLHELLHRGHAVKHAVVDVDVDDVGAVLNLLLGNVHGSAVVACHHELLELHGAGDVAALSDVEEGETEVVVDVLDDEVLEARKPHLRPTHVGELTRGVVRGQLPQGLDVRRRRPAAPSHHVQPPVLEEHLVVPRHVLGRVVVPSHGIGEACVGVHMHEALDDVG
mmetsp:Transcript_388/g.710  ORF Transcript_388/g.710 Transcript_388/m.710 type:complete len:351 (+) Transcript_388:2205-3257(+)